MQEPRTEYARSADGTFIAYQSFGAGPDLLIAFPWISHLELFWDDPDIRPWLEALARFARVITMDQRGIGLSDRMTQVIDLETKVDDVRAVLDATGSSRATLYGHGVDGGAICAMVAATLPERVRGLVFWRAQPCGGIQQDHPWHIEMAEQEAFQRLIAESWGDDRTFDALITVAGLPSILGDPQARRRWGRLMRNAASRGDALVHDQIFAETDYRSILPTIHVPTTILQPQVGGSEDDEARWMASQIPGCELVMLPAQDDHPPWVGPVEDNILALRTFLEGLHEEEASFDRVLATVLFTDVVGSTAKAVELGDRAWRELVERHHHIVRAMLARYRGVEVDTAGDGFFATFDGPARAVRCAQALMPALAPLDLEIRAGIHTGEVETIDGKHGGLAVVIGARIGALADASEVIVSQTVKDLTAGSGLAFEAKGEYELKGVPDRWHLYRAVS